MTLERQSYLTFEQEVDTSTLTHDEMRYYARHNVYLAIDMYANIIQENFNKKCEEIMARKL